MAGEVTFGWYGLTEDESTDAIPNKYVGTLATSVDGEMGDEVAVIVHRASDANPVDGDMYNAKDVVGAILAELLNEAVSWAGGSPKSHPHEAIESLEKIAFLASVIRDEA